MVQTEHGSYANTSTSNNEEGIRQQQLKMGYRVLDNGNCYQLYICSPAGVWQSLGVYEDAEEAVQSLLYKFPYIPIRNPWFIEPEERRPF